MARTALEKMGYKPGMSGWVRKRPDDLADRLPVPDVLADPHPAFILAFVSGAQQVAEVLPEILPHYARGNALWFAYPKKSGRLRSDISRDEGWDAVHRADLLPVTQIAIDEDWSALRFRYRDEIPKLTRASDAPSKRAGG
ncbi:hypothetical protein [Sphingomonas sp. UYP23]